MDVSNMLKTALAQGRLLCLGATTHAEYQRYFLKDHVAAPGEPAFERRFQKVDVAEPSERDTVAILERLKPAYKRHHGARIQDEALLATIRLFGRYVPARQFQDKAIDLVDEACATARLRTEILGMEGVPVDSNIIGPAAAASIAGRQARPARGVALPSVVSAMEMEMQVCCAVGDGVPRRKAKLLCR